MKGSAITGTLRKYRYAGRPTRMRLRSTMMRSALKWYAGSGRSSEVNSLPRA